MPLILLLLGCPWIGPGRLDEVRDLDGDGLPDCAFAEGARACDCDDDDPSVGAVDKRAFYFDADGDGLGGPIETDPACALPPGAADNADDCDDNDPLVGEGEPSQWYLDIDGDGFAGDTLTAPSCMQPPGTFASTTDCDDSTPAISPDADEVCDGPLGIGVDEDCDGAIDGENALGRVSCHVDQDGDGYGAPTARLACRCAPEEVLDGTDCNDDEADINSETFWFIDGDGDGFGGPFLGSVGCTPAQPDHVQDRTDCDDDDATVNPLVADASYDGVDSDCSGGTDLSIDGDDRPDVVTAPDAPGEPLPSIAAAEQACAGPAIVVSGGGGALQGAISASLPGALFTVPFVEGADNDYDGIAVPHSLCIVGDPGVRVVAGGFGDAAITIEGIATSTVVVVEGLELVAERGITATSDGLALTVSRVTMDGFDTLLDLRSDGLSTALLHHVTLSNGSRVGTTDGAMIVRDLELSAMAGADPSTALSLDLTDLTARSVATATYLFEIGDRTHIERVDIDGMLGGLVNVTGESPDLTLFDTSLIDATGTESLIRASGKSGPAQATVRRLRILGDQIDREGAALDLTNLVSLALSDSVIQVDNGWAAFLDATVVDVHHVVFASAYDGVRTNAASLSDITIAATDTCVEGTATEATLVTGHYLTGCTTENVDLFGAIFESANARFDLLRYDANAPVSTWDLRPHPRSFLKNGDWAPGFIGSTLAVDGFRLTYGAYTGSELIQELHDADGDGMYDTWEASYGLDDPTTDLDGDTLTNFQEFGDFDLTTMCDLSGITRPQGSDPTRRDTDDDGTDDALDGEPLNPVATTFGAPLPDYCGTYPL